MIDKERLQFLVSKTALINYKLSGADKRFYRSCQKEYLDANASIRRKLSGVDDDEYLTYFYILEKSEGYDRWAVKDVIRKKYGKPIGIYLVDDPHSYTLKLFFNEYNYEENITVSSKTFFIPYYNFIREVIK